MKVYTRTGDKGSTSLIGGKRVSKASAQLEAYGTADELNSCVGLLRAVGLAPEVDEVLHTIQCDLFAVGSCLALDFTSESLPINVKISDEKVSFLENRIDFYSENLPTLKNFILPAGCERAARAHVCRTVTRRLERRILAVDVSSEVIESALRYVNRLSDFFFVLARYVSEVGDCELV